MSDPRNYCYSLPYIVTRIYDVNRSEKLTIVDPSRILDALHDALKEILNSYKRGYFSNRDPFLMHKTKVIAQLQSLEDALHSMAKKLDNSCIKNIAYDVNVSQGNFDVLEDVTQRLQQVSDSPELLCNACQKHGNLGY